MTSAETGEQWLARYVDDGDRLYWRVVSYKDGEADVVADDLDEPTARQIATDHAAALKAEQTKTNYDSLLLEWMKVCREVEQSEAALKVAVSLLRHAIWDAESGVCLKHENQREVRTFLADPAIASLRGET